MRQNRKGRIAEARKSDVVEAFQEVSLPPSPGKHSGSRALVDGVVVHLVWQSKLMLM